MHHRRFGTAPARMRKTQHEMPPMILIIERNGALAGFKSFVGELPDWDPRIEIEHAQICPTKQSVRMGILRIEIDSLPQTVLSQTLLLHAPTPHARQGQHRSVPAFNVLRGLSLNARGLGDYDLRTDQVDDPVGN